MPEFALEEVLGTPDSVFEKMSRYFVESVGFQKKAKLAEKAWSSR